MIKHIVFIKSIDSNKVKSATIIKELAYQLRALEDLIKEIESIEVGINISKRESAYDLSLLTSFKNEDDLNTYRYHPEHQKVIDFIREYNLQTVVVDYNL